MQIQQILFLKLFTKSQRKKLKKKLITCTNYKIKIDKKNRNTKKDI
jgi:hypothetical protein